MHLSAAKHNLRLQIDYVSISLLKPNPGNPRIHSHAQKKKLKRSLREFGLVVPFPITAAGMVIDGHAILEIAREAGYETVPVVRIEYLNDVQVKALALALNRLSEFGRWDDDKLGILCKDLLAADMDFDIEATGFTLDEIEMRIEGLDDSGTDLDDLPLSIPDTSVVNKIGDVWLLGSHRLLCGDATQASDVELLMNGQRAAMCFADPPYNVDYANNAKNRLHGQHRPILNDNLGDGFAAFLTKVCFNVLAVTDGATYICMSSSELHTLYAAFAEAGGHWSTFIIWAKQAFTLGRADYQRQYEPILYGWRKDAKHLWCGARDQGDVWFYDKPIRNDLHPTMKPVYLVMRALRNSSERGDIVLDPFLGSGTTLIAAERTGRVCYGVELEPHYADSIIRRWQEHTGEHAIHAVTSRYFNDLATEIEVRDAR